MVNIFMMRKCTNCGKKIDEENIYYSVVKHYSEGDLKRTFAACHFCFKCSKKFKIREDQR